MHTSLKYNHSMTKHNKTARILHGIYSTLSSSTILSDSEKTKLYFTSTLNSKRMRYNRSSILLSKVLSYRNSHSKVSFLPLSRATVINNLSHWAIRTMNLQFKRATHHDITTCVAGDKLNFLQRQWYAVRRLLYIFILPTSTLQQSLFIDLLHVFIFNEYLTNKLGHVILMQYLGYRDRDYFSTSKHYIKDEWWIF